MNTITSKTDISSAKQQTEGIKSFIVVHNIVAMIIMFSICTTISIFFKQSGSLEPDIVMVYLLGIILFSYWVSSYFYSFLASVCGVLFYNFFFTEPYLTLEVYNPGYPITFLIMFLVGSFTSMLTIRLKSQTALAEEREQRFKALYQLERKLLGVKSSKLLAKVSAEELTKQFSADILVQFFDNTGKIQTRYVAGKDFSMKIKNVLRVMRLTIRQIAAVMVRHFFQKAGLIISP